MKILFGKISNGCNYLFGRTENDFVMAAVGAFIKTGEYGIHGWINIVFSEKITFPLRQINLKILWSSY